MWKKIAVFGLGMITLLPAIAATRGYYVGAQVGQSRASTDDINTTLNGNTITYQRKDTRGLAGRLVYGYMVQRSFGMEFGAIRYEVS